MRTASDLFEQSNKQDVNVRIVQTIPIQPERHSAQVRGDSAPVRGDSAPVRGDSAPVRGDSAPVRGDSAPVRGDSAPVRGDSTPVRGDSAPVDSKEELPKEVKAFLDDIGSRASKEQMDCFLLSACRWKDMKLQEMAALLDREPKYILRKYIQPLMNEGKLQYTIPDMTNHPKQAYTTTEKGRVYLESE